MLVTKIFLMNDLIILIEKISIYAIYAMCLLKINIKSF